MTTLNNEGVQYASSTSNGVSSAATLWSDVDNVLLTEDYRALVADWDRKMQALEAFNGQYFFNLPEQDPASLDFNFFDVKSQTEGANWGMRLEQSYDSLEESVYASQPKWLPVKNAGGRAARIQSQAVLAF